MTDAPPIPPLVVQFTVAASSDHAFRTWVDRPAMWWPPSHTLSGDPTSIVFEPRADGRIFEVDRSGTELPWGQIRVWEPPHRLEYSWHHFFPADEATHVVVSFIPSPQPDGAHTVVRIEQSGWDALGDLGPARRDGNTRGWSAVLDAFREHLQGGEP
jgi:uncharacterized protein YndB with AHSA1/START domain